MTVHVDREFHDTTNYVGYAKRLRTAGVAKTSAAASSVRDVVSNRVEFVAFLLSSLFL